MRACFDSVILIDYLRGIREANATIDSYSGHVISVVTWIEVLTGATSPDDERATLAALGKFAVVDLNLPVAQFTARIRRETRLKLPDAIILATARHLGCPLITRNTRDFQQSMPDVVVPYSL